jgi:hypothetical protein
VTLNVEQIRISVTVHIRLVTYLWQLIVGLERGPLSLVSTTEELLDRKVAAPV